MSETNRDETVRTEMAEFLVTGVRRSHLWLEVLHGDEQGMRVSVPLYSPEQDDAVNSALRSLEEGDIVSAVLGAEPARMSTWIVLSLQTDSDSGDTEE